MDLNSCVPGTVLIDSHGSGDLWATLWNKACLCWEDPGLVWWEVDGCASAVTHCMHMDMSVHNFDLEEFKVAFSSCFQPFVATSQSTWNSFGLLTSDPEIYGKKAKRAALLVNKHDISCIQETHGDSSSASVFYERVDDHSMHQSYDRISRNKGGLLTFVKSDLLRRISSLLRMENHWCFVQDNAVEDDVVPGRLHTVTFNWRDLFKLRVINLHIPPDWATERQIEFLKKVRRRILKKEEGLSVVLGDFNFGIDELDHVSVLDVLAVKPESMLAKFWNENFADLLEHYQENFTRADALDHVNPKASRIDRIYSTHDVLVLAAKYRHNVSTWGHALKERYDTSDHIPVSSCIFEEFCNPLARIPKWIEKDAVFREYLGNIHSKVVISGNPFEDLELYKMGVFEAAEEVRNLRKNTACTHTEGHIHFLLGLLRSLEARNYELLCRSCKGSAKVGELVNRVFPGYEIGSFCAASREKIFDSNLLRLQIRDLIAGLTLELQRRRWRT